MSNLDRCSDLFTKSPHIQGAPMQILKSKTNAFGMPLDNTSDGTVLSVSYKECLGGILLLHYKSG